MESTHKDHRLRTKKEFLARPDTFPDHKALEVLLYFANPRADTNPIAHALLEHFGSLDRVLDAAPEELVKVPGIGEHAAILLKVVKEVSRRYVASRTTLSGVVRRAEEFYEVLRPYFFGATCERVCVLCLDGKGRNLGIRQVSEGSVNAVQITARKVLEVALSLNASQVVLAHNHTSGLALPSDEDKATTKYMFQVLKAVDITLRDHVIFVDDDMVSLAESASGLLG